MPPAGVDEEESGRRTYLRERSCRHFSVLPFNENRENGKRKRKRKNEMYRERGKGEKSVRNSQERKH